MRCPRCQQENRPQAHFCAQCAELLARTGPTCGTQTSPSTKFRSESAQAPGAAAAPRFASSDTHTPTYLITPARGHRWRPPWRILYD